jgi:hypothetical protein
MEFIFGVVLYLVVIALFIAFGKFLKECDDGIREIGHKQ